MANQLVHVTNFPYESVVFDQYLLVSDGKNVASVVFITKDSVIGDDHTVEVKLGDDEPYEVDSLEEALTLIHERFGDVIDEANITFGQAKAARLIG